jgi:hypothetical protein
MGGVSSITTYLAYNHFSRVWIRLKRWAVMQAVVEHKFSPAICSKGVNFFLDIFNVHHHLIVSYLLLSSRRHDVMATSAAVSTTNRWVVAAVTESTGPTVTYRRLTSQPHVRGS